MKILIVMFCFLTTSAAVAQISGAGGGGAASSEPVITEFTSHPAHASQAGMAEAQSVLETSSQTIGQGERPVWELAPKVNVVPLGDIARSLKKDRLTAKKAPTVWEN